MKPHRAIVVKAIRETLDTKTGVVTTETHEYNRTWKLPDAAINLIVSSYDMKQAYFRCVLTHSKDVRIPVYDEFDVFQEWGIVGYEVFNYGEIHLKEFSTWLEHMYECGYTIFFGVK